MRIPAALTLAGLLALGACASGPEKPAKIEPITPTERYSIEVSPDAQELRLAAHAAGLSPNQTRALDDFVHQWMLAEGGEIVLKTPDHGGDPAGAYRTVTGARDLLVSEGVPAEKVRIVGYDAGGDVKAPILVGYLRYTAKGPECGREWGNLASTKDNDADKNFGCSMTANIAAQIANPADLLAPRDSDAPDAQRRQVVIDHFRKGDVTSTTKDAQANGAVSTAVN